ncbi:MAG TPA: carboxypeptidase regulatory-like domain-containing protein [Vicinamibacterales bacterium]|nr:carboxypeptidase regulatory-like domain-containing protein [Vicinamibacterales bacterium]
MRTRVGFVCLFVAALAAAPAIRAQLPLTLSGTVFGGSTVLPGALVEALQDGTTTVVGSSTTNSLGRYTLALPAATYDLRVTPPAGSGFGQETIQDVVLSADKEQDVVLVSGGGATLSGTVRGYGGAIVSGVNVTAQIQPTFQTVATVVTDANGQYSMPLTPGTYRILLNGSNRPNTPQSFSWDRRDLPVAGSQQFDVQLPVLRVSGTIRNTSSQPVQNARVQFSNNQSASSLFISSSGSNSFSASDGTYSYFAFPGNTSITVTPAAGSGLAVLTETFALSVDATRDYTLAAVTLTTVTGVVRGYQSQPIPFAQIQAFTWPQGQFLGFVSADAGGNYSLPLPSLCRLIVFGSTGPGNSFQWDRRNLSISSSQMDIQVPVSRITGDVANSSGSPVPGATVRAAQSFFANDLFVSASSQSSSDVAGRFTMLTVNGPTTLTALPPTGANLGMAADALTLMADTEHDLILPDAVRISGVVRGYGGMPVSFATVELRRASDALILTSGSTTASGTYDLPSIAGNVRVRVFPGGRPNAPQSATWDRASVPVAGPTTFDVDLPVVRLAGRVTDSNGVGVPGVRVQVSNSRFQSSPQLSVNSFGSVLSDAQGRYSMLLLSGSGSLTVQPPAASGFVSSTLSNFSINADLDQAIVLQRPDTTPPTIVSGPTVLHLSDTSVSIGWTTNEPATSRVSFGLGTLTQTLSDNALVTNHSVTLLDLVGLETYTYQVSSIDRAGNGPVSSGQAFFTTQPFPGDVTPPVITGGPSIAFVDQTTAIVQWTTDEPATSTLDYGETPALGTVVPSPLGRFLQSHSVRITGLTPATTFFLRVRPADPDGNEVESGMVSLTTLTVPDTQAPVITEGPAATSVSDTSMTITWRTDEPSDSGVSYNNGTNFFTVRDEAFVRQHSVTLTGLTSVTSYQVTVSSRDAVGNGPTLGGPITAVTAATPDTTAPVISNASVSEIGETSVVITWNTDEPSTSTVAFGTTSGSLSDSRADVALTRDHRIVLTGLSGGTAYYFTVSSADAASNAATTGEGTFATRQVVVDNPPTAPGTPTASRNPSNTGTFTVSWNPATDDNGIAGYDVLRNGAAAAQVASDTTLYQESGLAEGSYTYRIRARDTGGHSALSGELSVIVDLTAPVLATPGPVNVDATAPTGAEVTFQATATDNFDAQPSITCSPASGSHFNIGATTVNCQSADAAGHTASASFVVTVRDVFAPALAVPGDIEVDATTPAGAVVLFTVTASDNADPAPVVSCDHEPGATYPVGSTTVTCTARDVAGNMSDQGTFDIKVAGAAEQAAATSELITGFNLPATTEQALTVKIEQALTAPNATSSCNELGALINTVRAQQRSGRLTVAQADAIISATQQVMIVQGCR